MKDRVSPADDSIIGFNRKTRGRKEASKVLSHHVLAAKAAAARVVLPAVRTLARG